MADKIGAGWEGPGQTAFREFTVGGETVHARMVSLPPGDELTIAGEIDIASYPTVTLTTLSGVCDASGANTLVAAPAAGNHHVLYAFQFALKEKPVTLQNVLLKSDTTEMWNYPATDIGAGIVIFLPPGQELHWGSAKAIVADLAEAKDVAYVIRYRTIAD